MRLDGLRLHCLFLMPFHPPSYLSVSEMNSYTPPGLLAILKEIGLAWRHMRSFVCFLLRRPRKNFSQQRSDQLKLKRMCTAGCVKLVRCERPCKIASWVIEIILMHVFLLRRKCKSFPFGQDVALGSYGMVGVTPGLHSPQLNLNPCRQIL